MQPIEPAELRVRVLSVETSAGLSRATVAVAHGTDDAGRHVTFAGEPRYLTDLAAALEAGEPVSAVVPSWAILSATPEPAA